MQVVKHHREYSDCAQAVDVGEIGVFGAGLHAKNLDSFDTSVAAPSRHCLKLRMF
jgi:hypothetical protein